MRLPIAIAAFTAALITPVFAETQNCVDRDLLVERLRTGYGEVFSGAGLQNGEAVFEIWTSEENGTWTILMTQPDGMSCIMATGTDWLPALASQTVKGSPT